MKWLPFDENILLLSGKKVEKENGFDVWQNRKSFKTRKEETLPWVEGGGGGLVENKTDKNNNFPI